MKRAILLTLAAAVATLPALWGVTGNTTFGQSVPAAIPSGASVAPSVDSRSSAPTATASIDDRGRGSDDASTAAPATASTTDDRRGRGSGEATTSSPTRIATQAVTTSGSRTTSTRSTTATTAATVDDKGGSTSGADDSSGRSGKGGSGKG